MQKVEGSNPFSRSSESLAFFAGLSAFPGRAREPSIRGFLRLLSFHRPRAFLSVGMRPAAGRGSGPGLTAGQQPEGLVDRAAEDLLELLRAVPPRSSTCW
jgi:hypothetical protein